MIVRVVVRDFGRSCDFFGQDELAAIRLVGRWRLRFFRTRASVRKNGCGISDGRADFSDKTNWQPYDRAVIFSDTGERPKNGCGISDGRADFSDKTNWQPYDRAVIYTFESNTKVPSSGAN